MALRKLFGTDGIRGNVNEKTLLPESFALIGRILGFLAQRLEPFSGPKVITIGRDTRSSGLYLESALVAGINAMGVSCELVGVMPTAAVAQAALRSKACFGVMISASHNDFNDNGIKLFGAAGFKADEELEKAIEELYFSGGPFEISPKAGSVYINDKAELTHKEYLLKEWGLNSLKHLRLAVDCAHGAATYMAPPIFKALGLEIACLGIEPDGSNINRGYGSEAPNQIQSAVLSSHAHLGIAFDGDADRVIFVDEKGSLIDGDAILATMAIYLKKRGLLAQNTLIATIMSSVALDRALMPHDIKVERTGVGDKYVAQAMAQGGFSFGGENSGHILMFPHATTGDGILSALMFLGILSESGQRASELVSFFESSPRLLKNIAVTRRLPLSSLPKTEEAIIKANSELRDQGRVLFRYSGTENKARLLVEASSESECERIAEYIGKEFSDEMATLVQ